MRDPTLAAVGVRPIGDDERARFDAELDRHHWLGHSLVGETMRCAEVVDDASGWLALLGFVILGEARARSVTRAMMVAFYPALVLLAALGALPWSVLVAFLGISALAKVWSSFSSFRPAEKPKRWPIWPLWFAALAFVHTRRACALFIVGLAVGAADWTSRPATGPSSDPGARGYRPGSCSPRPSPSRWAPRRVRSAALNPPTSCSASSPTRPWPWRSSPPEDLDTNPRWGRRGM